MSKTFIILIMTLIAVTTVVVLIREREAEPQTSSEAALHITTHTSDQIVGYFDSGSSRVVFESRVETPLLVSAQIRVSDFVYDASANLKENIRVLDGHGQALSAVERSALTALSKELEIYLEPYKQNLPQHEDFLVRIVLYLSEAPVGLPLIKQEIRP